MILHCIRHGESEFNAQHRIQGQLDPPLSPLGIAQSRALASALAGLPTGVVVHSPLRRAVETATPVAEAAKRRLVVLDDLQEIHAGVFQGSAWAEIVARYPDEARRWKNQDPDFRPEGGETRRELMERGRKAFEAIRALDEKEVIVVTHGGLLGAALKALLRIPAEENPFRFYNCGWNAISWEGRWRVGKINDVAHLQDLDEHAGLGDL